MKRKCMMLLLCLLACVGMITAAGDASDPLISLSYLTGSYTNTLLQSLEGKFSQADKTLLDQATQQLNQIVSQLEVGVNSDFAPSFLQRRLKQGDLLAGTTGTSFVLLAGEAKVEYSSGTVLDVTQGTRLASGSTLVPSHRYLVGEETSAVFSISSRTAVVEYEGYYLLTLSESVDYNAMANALKLLDLFRGSDTSYGNGYDLEVAPTRIQAVILLLRILGEEEAALACQSSHPFRDVPDWCDRYVAYAYQQGYVNGVSPTEFDANSKITPVQFTELLLRATGYSIAGVDDWSTSLERARDAGVITAGEYQVYTTTEFLRADCVYFCYYLLDTPLKNSGITLAQRLISAGAFDSTRLQQAKAMVSSARIS